MIVGEITKEGGTVMTGQIGSTLALLFFKNSSEIFSIKANGKGVNEENQSINQFRKKNSFSNEKLFTTRQTFL